MANRTRKGNGGGLALEAGPLFRGLVAGYALSLLAGGLMGLFVAWTAWAPPPEAKLFRVIALVAVGAGGVAAGQAALRGAWLHGALVGALYLGLLVLLLGAPAGITAGQWVAAFSFVILAGGLGGMVGTAFRGEETSRRR